MGQDESRCSLCGEHNFRQCDCPWHKPFSDWPRALLDKVKTIVAENPFKP